MNAVVSQSTVLSEKSIKRIDRTSSDNNYPTSVDQFRINAQLDKERKTTTNCCLFLSGCQLLMYVDIVDLVSFDLM